MTTKLDDLVKVLETGEIAGAALDVYEQEPLPSDHRLWTLPNVLLTPHMAGHGPYLNDRRFQIIVDFRRRTHIAQCGGQVVLVLSRAVAQRFGVAPTNCKTKASWCQFRLLKHPVR